MIQQINLIKMGNGQKVKTAEEMLKSLNAVELDYYKAICRNPGGKYPDVETDYYTIPDGSQYGIRVSAWTKLEELRLVKCVGGYKWTPLITYEDLLVKIELDKLKNPNLRQLIDEICDDHDLKCTYWGGDTDYEATKEAKEDLYNKIQSRITELESENTALKLEVDKLKEAFGLNEPWPVTAVLEKLVFAADFLLSQYNYDGQGWEDISHCTDVASEMITKINSVIAEQALKENP